MFTVSDAMVVRNLERTRETQNGARKKKNRARTREVKTTQGRKDIIEKKEVGGSTKTLSQNGGEKSPSSVIGKGAWELEESFVRSYLGAVRGEKGSEHPRYRTISTIRLFSFS